MKTKQILLVALLLVPSLATALPTGVPAPGFGFAQVPPPTCIVDNSHPDATDVSNPCGTVAKPRATIPTAFPAGSAWLVRGGPYQTSATLTWTISGTADAPVFIYGEGRPRLVGNGIGHRVHLAGSFGVVQGLVLQGVKVEVGGTAIAIRSSEVSGNISTPGVTVFGAGTVLAQNTIHHNGDSTATTERDFHGVYVAPGSRYTWVLENDIYRNGGDAVQVGNTSRTEPWATHVFVAGNRLHEDRENGVDVKVSRYVVIAQNLVYGYRPVSSANGEAIVVHNEPQLVFVVNNTILFANYGIVSTGAVGMFVVGNIVTGITGAPSASLYSSAAISVYNTQYMWVVHNTIFGGPAGILYPQLVGASHQIFGNLVIGTTRAIQGNGQVLASHNLIEGVGFTQPAILNFHTDHLEAVAGAEPHDVFALYQSIFAVPITTDIYHTARTGTFTLGAAQHQ